MNLSQFRHTGKSNSDETSHKEGAQLALKFMELKKSYKNEIQVIKREHITNLRKLKWDHDFKIKTQEETHLKVMEE